MKFATILRDLRKKNGYTQEALAEKLKIAKSTVSMYEHGERMPNYATMQALADLFAVEMDVLYGREALPLPHNVRTVKTKKIPLLGEIACGEPIFAQEEHQAFVEAGENIQADFCLTAKGDSMIGARIHDGDVVFIRSQPMVENGEIAAVIIEDEATLKRWYYYPDTEKLVLTPENPSYEPLVYVGTELESVRCLGKAICFMSNL
ncbi:MAG: helix-turn-helix domain-containing protein [Clostridia bacterium]|nr:helix-turn-helix domain-containing protein [Clostridia bacterium]